MTNLQDRIAAALKPDAELWSGEIDRLLREVESEAEKLRQDHYDLSLRAVDPATIDAEASRLRTEAGELQFRLERLTSARDRLRVALKDAQEAEEDRRRRDECQAAEDERDRLAAELTALYPEMEARLTRLLAAIEANNARVRVVNFSRPSGAGPIKTVEEITRGIRPERVLGDVTDLPRLLESVRLPKFKPDALKPYAWPRADRPLFVG